MDSYNDMRCAREWTPWSMWTSCTATCGDSTRTRERTCEGFGRRCPGPWREYDPCPVDRLCSDTDGGWSNWSPWTSECSVSCGQGVRIRTRECDSPVTSGRGHYCDGPPWESQPCLARVFCIIDGNWSPWSDLICDVTCGYGICEYIAKLID